jgi:hypothetical protein
VTPSGFWPKRGGCLRPVQLRRTNLDTGQVDQQIIPCGSTLEATCPACAKRAKSLRAEQCGDGWHLENEPDPGQAEPDETQEYWLTLRGEAQVRRDQAEATGDDTNELDELIGELDDELARAGIRGTITRNTGGGASKNGTRRSRSTRRRQDAPKLPKRPATDRTTGRVFTAPDGKAYRPSMFLTLTCDSYGRVREDGTPADAGSYDYRRAARDAIHFPALFDRLIQNLRRYLGYDVQYFAAIEPQRRLAPHAHIAFRGAISRTDLRQVIAATIGPADEPLHVARFGPKFDAQGVLAGTRDSARCIGYLTKYLTKQIAGCHTADTDAQRAHADRLIAALRYEPCSPTCANWLRYGVQPKNPRAGQIPGLCKGKAHRPENLGYAGRRVLVSRKWSGKTLADHRADRKAWLLAMLGLPAVEDHRYRWERVTPADPDHMPPARRLLHILTDRARWQAALAEARRRAQEASGDLSATRRAA